MSKSTDKTHEEHIDDVVIEDVVADGEEASSFDRSEDSQVAKLKKKLKECETQAKENLDGWQRLKADVANMKKAEVERSSRAKEQGAEAVLDRLLPALDSFNAAMQADAWQQVDAAWRQGMEFVYTQFETALTESGIVSFGVVGDTFDPLRFEASEHIAVEHEDQEGKVQKVLRKGYALGDRVLRPAKVVVGDYPQD